MNKEKTKEYMQFMRNKANIMNCTRCPENLRTTSNDKSYHKCGLNSCYVYKYWKDED